MRLLIIHNPSAGDGSEGDEIERVARQHGHDVTTVEPTPAWPEAALRCDAELVVVAGGDGTVRKVLTSVDEVPWTMAVLPLGTANNIARSLGLAVAEPFAEIAAWTDGRTPADFHVPVVVDDDRDAPFVESFGGGFVAEALASAEGSDDGVDDGNEHGRRHLLEVLGRARPERWTLEIDGRDHSGEYLAVEVMNVPTVGPILALAPSARPDDGRLDVVLVTEDDREPLFEVIRDGADPGELRFLAGTRCETVRMRPPSDVALHLDDELFDGDGSRCSVEVGRRTVRMLRA